LDLRSRAEAFGNRAAGNGAGFDGVHGGMVGDQLTRRKGMRMCRRCLGSGALCRPTQNPKGSRCVTCRDCNGSGCKGAPIDWRNEREKWI
jgi:hypothetical protein